MTGRLYIDEDPHEEVGDRLSRDGLDALTTRGAGHKGRTDPWQLAFAAREQRVFVACNVKHFEMLHEAWTSWSDEWGVLQERRCAGILEIPNGREIEIDATIAIVRQILDEQPDLSNRLFRWRHSTGWIELFPGDRNVDSTSS